MRNLPNKKSKMKIVILGSGNVASTLAQAFRSYGHTIAQVYSRNKANANALASLLASSSTDKLEQVVTDADIYCICVSDQAISSVVAALPEISQGIVVHCSGATSITVLHRFEHHGVLYPLQSISKAVTKDLTSIPFVVEGNNETTTTQLLNLILPLAPKAFQGDSAQRLALHVAAVFANNFTNLLFQISQNILEEHQLPFDLLRPIILETAQKVQTCLPEAVQTGPAKRGDMQTIETHLNFLSESPHWIKIYQQLTEEILRRRDSE